MYSRSGSSLAGSSSAVGTTSTAKSASRSASARSSSSSARGFESRRSLASNTTRPRAGPLQAPMSTTTSPVLPDAPRWSPTASDTSPWRRAMRVDRVGDRLLEGAPLGGALLALSGDLLELALLVAEPLELLPELPQLLEQRTLGGVGAVGRLGDRLERAGLEVGERVRAVGRRELAHHVLARAHERLGHELAHAVLDRGRATVAEELLEVARKVPVLGSEHLVDLRAEVLGDRAGLVGELTFELAGRALELGLHVLGVGGRLLAVEHPRADHERVANGLDGIVAGLLALAHEPDRAFVLHVELANDEPVADHGDVGLPEGGGCFHGCLVPP